MILFLTLPLQAQITLETDTISIDEVIISGNRTNVSTGGYKVSGIDSAVLNIDSHLSLADLLSRHTSLYIKSYGAGGAASPSFRGTGAGHTQVTWNDVNINHPMLGQSDLSLIPTGFLDDVELYYGGASMTLTSGGLGGVINLETRPDWEKRTIVTLNPGIASFGQYTGLVKVKAGNQSFQSVTKAFWQSAENDFPYLNDEIGDEPVKQVRSDSEVRQRGLMQELYFRHPVGVTSARLWYQSADRNLPSSMLNQQPGLNETQKDESLRTMISHDHSSGAGNLNLTGAYLMSRLDYTNSLASVDSRNRSHTAVLKGAWDRKLGSVSRISILLDEQLCFVQSNNYEDDLSRNTLSLTASAERNFGNRFTAMLLIREILDRGELLIPDFSAGTQYRLVSGKEYLLKANFSRNSKIPSLNDLYWMPGGNPDLRNEYSYTYELSATAHEKIAHSLDLKFDLTLFRNDIRDMIQWHPGEYSYWTADNIRSVRTSGLETSFSLGYSRGKLASGLTGNYSFTRAVNLSSAPGKNISAGNQLIYVPEHQGNCTMVAGYGWFQASWILTYTGRRYVTADNSDFLPGYVLNNLTAGCRFTTRATLLSLTCGVENIFNTSYQAIAHYPMPGRSYSMKLLIQISK